MHDKILSPEEWATLRMRMARSVMNFEDDQRLSEHDAALRAEFAALREEAKRLREALSEAAVIVTSAYSSPEWLRYSRCEQTDRIRQRIKEALADLPCSKPAKIPSRGGFGCKCSAIGAGDCWQWSGIKPCPCPCHAPSSGTQGRTPKPEEMLRGAADLEAVASGIRDMVAGRVTPIEEIDPSLAPPCNTCGEKRYIHPKCTGLESCREPATPCPNCQPAEPEKEWRAAWTHLPNWGVGSRVAAAVEFVSKQEAIDCIDGKLDCGPWATREPADIRKQWRTKAGEWQDVETVG